MRRLAAFRAATLLATLALALAACTGGELPPAPAATPEASPTVEAPSTPAPVATAEATPTPAPAPPPEAACANGIAVEEPEANPGLVADCVALLASRDALRGEVALDWGAELAIESWEGVAVEDEPPRVTGLDLRDKGLTGSIPRTLGALTELTYLRLAGNRLTGVIPRGLGEMESLRTLILVDNALTGGIPRSIGRLRLDEVRLSGNALTGCVPSAFGDAGGDVAYLGLPWCLRYDRLDATGEVVAAGEWAVLGADGEVLATWEGLRSEAATLRVHQTDAGGTSWAAEFGAVSEGGLFEWWGAIDCWVRYLVTGAPVPPAGGSGRWEFPIQRISYAPTGCAGAIPAAATLRAEEQPAPLDAAVVTSPIWHGPYLLSPYGDWSGTWPGLPSPLPGPVPAVGSQSDSWRSDDLATVQRHPLWRDPDLPDDWRPISVSADRNGLEAVYATGRGHLGLKIYIARYDGAARHVEFLSGMKAHMIDGYPAVTSGPRIVELFDTRSGILYGVHIYSRSRTLSPTAAVLSMMQE